MKCKDNKKQSSKDIIYLTRLVLICVLVLSVTFEVIIFPTIENIFGCIMMIISYVVFVTIFLKRSIIVEFPFAFIMFLSIFMYRFLPVPATLLEGIPVSYGMEVPIKTFILETILFLVSSCAFYFSILKNNNNFIQILFKNIGFYKFTNRKTLWIMGLVGCLIRIITFSMGSIKIGNILGKLLMPFITFMYIPMLLFFDGFYTGKYEKKPKFNQPATWIYLIFISILNLAANSRESLIEPIAIIGILYMLYLFINNIYLNQIMNIKRLISLIMIGFISLKLLNIASNAILSIRDIRNDISFTELIEGTMNNIIDNKGKTYKYNNKVSISSYMSGWTESYLSNFILNRYANMRITDETLYLGELIKNNNMNKRMFDDFIARIITILPQPFIDIIGLDINKNDYLFSRGDALYVYSGIGSSYNLGGYRVTSHIADGIVTFGAWYFIIQFLVFFIVFKLLNCYSYRDKNQKMVYSFYGIFSVYKCLNIFRNANGIIGEITFVFRDYWQEIIFFIILFGCARFIAKIRIK